MTPTTIGVREFQRDFASVTAAVERGQSFIVVRHAKPIARLVPVEDEKKRKYTLKDLETLRFSGGKNLSKEIDKIVYGV